MFWPLPPTRPAHDTTNSGWSQSIQSGCKRTENCLNFRVKLTSRVCELHFANPWKIASSKGSGGTHRTVIVELTAADGLKAIGEAAPSSLYGESSEGVLKFLPQLDADRLSFSDVPGSMAYLGTVPGIPFAAKCAL